MACFILVMRKFGGFCKIAQNRSVILLYNKNGQLRRSSSVTSDAESSQSEDENQKRKLKLARPRERRHTKNIIANDNEGDIDPVLVAAAKSVVEAVKTGKSEMESDLLQQLRAHSKITKAQKHGAPPGTTADIHDLFTGMKIDRRRKKHGDKSDFETQHVGQRRKFPERTGIMDESRSIISGLQREAGIADRVPSHRSRQNQAKLFEGSRLGLFDIKKFQNMASVTKVSEQPSLWDVVTQEELDCIIDRTPVNAYEEMIRWTKRGKMWKFPIDNEQGWNEEAKVSFQEHVFLEKYLEDFPKKGPVRHFMDIIVTSLSKNPYLTVEQKKGHILWFRDYFEEKKDLIDQSLIQAGVKQVAEA